jgi:glutaryl-CoA dehydrogenase
MVGVLAPDKEIRRPIMTDPITKALADNIGRARGTDYFLMKEQLKPEEAEILGQVREFAEADVLPLVNSYW